MVTIRRFLPELELTWLTELWNVTIGSPWSIVEDELRSHLSSASILLVAERDDSRLGFIAAACSDFNTAVLLAILVEKRSQRQEWALLFSPVHRQCSVRLERTRFLWAAAG